MILSLERKLQGDNCLEVERDSSPDTPLQNWCMAAFLLLWIHFDTGKELPLGARGLSLCETVKLIFTFSLTFPPSVLENGPNELIRYFYILSI